MQMSNYPRSGQINEEGNHRRNPFITGAVFDLSELPSDIRLYDSGSWSHEVCKSDIGQQKLFGICNNCQLLTPGLLVYHDFTEVEVLLFYLKNLQKYYQLLRTECGLWRLNMEMLVLDPPSLKLGQPFWWTNLITVLDDVHPIMFPKIERIPSHNTRRHPSAALLWPIGNDIIIWHT